MARTRRPSDYTFGPEKSTEIARRLLDVLARHGMTPYKVSQQTGIPTSNLTGLLATDLEKRRKHHRRLGQRHIDEILAVAKATKEERDYVLGGEIPGGLVSEGVPNGYKTASGPDIGELEALLAEPEQRDLTLGDADDLKKTARAWCEAAGLRCTRAFAEMLIAELRRQRRGAKAGN